MYKTVLIVNIVFEHFNFVDKVVYSCYGDVALCTSESSDDGVNGDEGV